MAISKEECLKRKRIAEKLRRQRILEDPKRCAEENQKRRDRKARKKIRDANRKISPKEEAALRKKWRDAKRRYVAKKAISALKEDFSTCRSNSMKTILKKRAASKRVKNYRLIQKLINQNLKLQKKVNMYKVRCSRLQQKFLHESDSSNSVLKRSFKANSAQVSDHVKRQLLFGKSVLADVGESFSKIRSPTMRKTILGNITFKYVTKYNFLSEAKPFFRFRSLHSLSQKRVFGVKRKHMIFVKNYVEKFFQDDEVTTLSPCKGDQIVKRKVKKQKRYLSNSLQYLFKKFCEKSPFVISYSSFCKLRPFWCVNRGVCNRDTCLCKKCENAQFMCKSLRKENVINDQNIDRLMENELCCSPATEVCLARECNLCGHKTIEILEFDGSIKCYFEQWIRKKEVGRDNVERTHSVKERIKCSVREMAVAFFENVLPEYMQHKRNDLHQKAALRTLKKELTETDLLLHIDFAENYACKYGQEIQEIHFGGNRPQISIHTGVLYTSSMKQAFSTVTQDLNHGPVAIVQHLQLILRPCFKKIENLHFFSDAPATQYRNRHMFYLMIKKIIPSFKVLKTFAWHYSEAGHGKGAPDGVGATLKRTCDRVVGHNRDIANFDQFLQCVTERVKRIKIISLPSVVDKTIEEEVQISSKAVKGKQSFGLKT